MWVYLSKSTLASDDALQYFWNGLDVIHLSVHRWCRLVCCFFVCRRTRFIADSPHWSRTRGVAAWVWYFWMRSIGLQMVGWACQNRFFKALFQPEHMVLVLDVHIGILSTILISYWSYVRMVFPSGIYPFFFSEWIVLWIVIDFLDSYSVHNVF